MSEEEMILRMFRSIYASLMSRMNEFCSAYQLTGVQCLIMLELQEDEVTISELAQRMMMKPSNVSGVVKRMVKRGLVQRRRSTQDERIVYVSLQQDALNTISDEMKTRLVDSLFHDISREQITEILHAVILLDTCIRRCEHE